jgi:two-component system alkaline phosphatase synthesis response regulator PhoP
MPNLPVILTVDDEQDFLDLINAKLKANGFSILKANNGQEALEIVKKSKPDLILMDVQMPKKDGIQTTAELKSNPETKNIKIIFLTNFGDASPIVSEQNRRFAKQAVGADDYFNKGGDLDILVEKIQALLKK